MTPARRRRLDAALLGMAEYQGSWGTASVRDMIRDGMALGYSRQRVKQALLRWITLNPDLIMTIRTAERMVLMGVATGTGSRADYLKFRGWISHIKVHVELTERLGKI